MQMKVDVSRKFFQIELELLKMKNVREEKPKSFFLLFMCNLDGTEKNMFCFVWTFEKHQYFSWDKNTSFLLYQRNIMED